MYPRPVEVSALEDYTLCVDFSNGERRVFDASVLLNKPLYRKLKNHAYFARAKTDGMCVFWDDDVDICPDKLYVESVLLTTP